MTTPEGLKRRRFVAHNKALCDWCFDPSHRFLDCNHRAAGKPRITCDNCGRIHPTMFCAHLKPNANRGQGKNIPIETNSINTLGYWGTEGGVEEEDTSDVIESINTVQQLHSL